MPFVTPKACGNADGVIVRFWGVRGSIPTPTSSHFGTGGNTACVEVQHSSGSSCILDLGTGAHELGHQLVAQSNQERLDLHVFLSHFHWDHIQAVPFFAPLFDERNSVTFYGSDMEGAPFDLLREQMSVPFFPVSFDDLAAETRQIVLTGDDPVEVGTLTVTPFPVHHTQFVFGFKIEAGGRSVVYCTDYEHGNQVFDERLIEIASGADLLICDAQYTPEEYSDRIGWGHTTWKHATGVASKANVRELALFHHDPGHDDVQLAEILHAAQQAFPNTVLATEGRTIVL